MRNNANTFALTLVFGSLLYLQVSPFALAESRTKCENYSEEHYLLIDFNNHHIEDLSENPKIFCIPVSSAPVGQEVNGTLESILLVNGQVRNIERIDILYFPNVRNEYIGEDGAFIRTYPKSFDSLQVLVSVPRRFINKKYKFQFRLTAKGSGAEIASTKSDLLLTNKINTDNVDSRYRPDTY